MLAAFHQPVRFSGFGKGEGGVDHGVAEALIEQGPDLVLQRLGDVGFFLAAAGAQGGAGEGQALAHDGHGVEFDAAAFEEGDLYQSAFNGEGFDVAGDVVAADHVEDDVDAVAVGGLLEHLDEVFFVVVDYPVRTGTPAGIGFFAAADRRVDTGAELLGELDGGQADAAGAAVYQEGFAGLQGTALEHVAPHGEVGFRQGGRFQQ